MDALQQPQFTRDVTALEAAKTLLEWRYLCPVVSKEGSVWPARRLQNSPRRVTDLLSLSAMAYSLALYLSDQTHKVLDALATLSLLAPEAAAQRYLPRLVSSGSTAHTAHFPLGSQQRTRKCRLETSPAHAFPGEDLTESSHFQDAVYHRRSVWRPPSGLGRAVREANVSVVSRPLEGLGAVVSGSV